MERAIIRPAKPADYPAIRRILGYYIEHTTASWRYEVPGPSWIEQFDSSHQTPERPVFVAEISDLIVGYSCLSDFRPYEGYWPCAENSIYVLPDYLGQKIGQQLMSVLLAAAARTRLKKSLRPLTATIRPVSVFMNDLVSKRAVSLKTLVSSRTTG